MDAEEREDLAGTTLRLEQAARDGDERFRRLVADLPVGVLSFGRRSEVLFVNRAALELLGFSEDEVLGRTSLDVGALTVREDGSPFPAEEHPGPVALATGKPVRGVVIGFYRPAIKDRVWLLVSAHPQIGPGGRPDQVIVTLSEITARRRAEERLRESEARYRRLAEEALRAEEALETQRRQLRESALQTSRLKSALLANMSHELRTPLNGVLGMARLLLEGPLEAKQRERAQAVADSGQELLAMVMRILEYAELEAGPIELKLADVELRPLAAGMVEAFADEASSKVLQLTATVAEGLPPAIRADGVRIGQVLGQLVANALKFTETGYVELRVLRDERRGGRVRFEVEDTGIGIPEASLQGLFEPFHQADASTTRRHRGTGIGLAIARRLVEAMGGEIGVRPRHGGGSIFSFSLPIAPVHAGEAVPRPAPASSGAAASAQSPPLVLVVEDHPVNRKITVTMLENLGYRADVAATGLDALQACSVTRYDAILMDCQMPDMDGFKATAWIRQREADTKQRTPIIALTASMMPGDREKCLAAGMDEYLAKPVRIQALDATLRRWMACPGPSPPVRSPETGEPVASALPPDHPLRVLEAQGRGRVVVEIIDLFLQTTPLRLDALRQVLAGGDAESLASLAHSLKGAALQLGSRGMAALCSRIQAEARGGSVAGVGPLLDELESEYDSVRQVLESERARLGGP